MPRRQSYPERTLSRATSRAVGVPAEFWPRRWLMTDERLGTNFLSAIGRVGPEGGIVFRHYTLAEKERRRLFDRVRAAHSGLLLLAGTSDEALLWGADGSHGGGGGCGLRSAPVHSYAQIRRAERDGTGLLFLSPVFPTRSHLGAPTLGLARFAWLARRAPLPVIALGGMNEARWHRLASFGAYGWAGIDAFG